MAAYQMLYWSPGQTSCLCTGCKRAVMLAWRLLLPISWCSVFPHALLHLLRFKTSCLLLKSGSEAYDCLSVSWYFFYPPVITPPWLNRPAESLWLVPSELWILLSLQPGHRPLPVPSVFKDHVFIFLCCFTYWDLYLTVFHTRII